MKKSTVIHTGQYERDGITYEIRVVREEGALWGEWTCGACGGTGASSSRETEIKMAVWSAQTNTGGHHHFNHRKTG